MKPKIYETDKGKRYFIIHGKRFYFNPKLSKKELIMIYKMLKKRPRLIQASKSVSNTAKAIVNINQQAPRRRRKRPNKAPKPQVDPKDRVTVGHAGVQTINSNLEDLNNKLINEAVKKGIELEVAKKQQIPNQPQPQINHQPLPNIDYSIEGRILALQNYPPYIEFLANPNKTME